MDRHQQLLVEIRHLIDQDRSNCRNTGFSRGMEADVRKVLQADEIIEVSANGEVINVVYREIRIGRSLRERLESEFDAKFEVWKKESRTPLADPRIADFGRRLLTEPRLHVGPTHPDYQRELRRAAKAKVSHE
jgi:hypothetical protein